MVFRSRRSMLTSDLRGQHPTMERPLHTRRMQPKAAASTGRRFRTICGVFLMFVMAEFIGSSAILVMAGDRTVREYEKHNKTHS